MLLDGTWREDESVLIEAAAAFFNTLFADNEPLIGSFPIMDKFSVEELCPILILTTRCTPLRRALSKAWNDLRNSLVWSIGNDSSINPLDDTWIPHLGPLRTHITTIDDLTRELAFSDLMDGTGQWDTQKLSTFFTLNAIPHIFGIKCPDADKLVWRWNPKHPFNVKSAYHHRLANLWTSSDPIWKTSVPQHVRLFLWLTYKHRLMTNESIAHHTSCPVELVIHVLRDCRITRQVWTHVIPFLNVHTLFNSNVQDWLYSNMKS
ncbi:hypothetical protein V6N11_077792 [Hibiscus sabdariffa]|uniref:Reverse transcriptase zinc-binding domain-containing protein n=1 Tax=Hibiscus sabdariffa TaxID=183260 RepID=A0ABR2TEH8_9ROSI